MTFLVQNKVLEWLLCGLEGVNMTKDNEILDGIFKTSCTSSCGPNLSKKHLKGKDLQENSHVLTKDPIIELIGLPWIFIFLTLI